MQWLYPEGGLMWVAEIVLKVYPSNCIKLMFFTTCSTCGVAVCWDAATSSCFLDYFIDFYVWKLHHAKIYIIQITHNNKITSYLLTNEVGFCGRLCKRVRGYHGELDLVSLLDWSVSEALHIWPRGQDVVFIWLLLLPHIVTQPWAPP